MEEWRAILNYENYYEISNKGRVRSLTRVINNNGGLITKIGKILTLSEHTSGYYQVILNKNNISVHKYVHRLVAQHFLDTYNKNLVTNHINGDKKCNEVSNLECCTQYDNIKHAIRTGLTNTSGENAYNAKFKNKDISDIKKLFNSGKNLKYISEFYKVSKPTICRIINNKTYKNS